eukprot:m.476788 g.476788  ORF g.476788 m.476788 type:complete len:473 (-) comp41799_c0_seq1:27-1445(-)
MQRFLNVIGLIPLCQCAGTDRDWATDPRLEAAVVRAGFGDCTLQHWVSTSPDPPSFAQPLVFDPSDTPLWARARSAAQWNRRPFLENHGSQSTHVRLPTGQRQSGLLVRETTIREFADESTVRQDGVEPGVLLSRAPRSVLDATEQLLPPSPLAVANLSAGVLSIGSIGVGLPFHNHGAAWLTVLKGKKLVVLTPPRTDADPEFWGLQHRNPISWAILPPEAVRRRFEAAGLLTPNSTLPLHCVLSPGTTLFIPCNWYHATLNIDETLAVGGQQPALAAGTPADGKNPSPAMCPSDADATAHINFVQATAAIARASADVDLVTSAKLLAMGEVLLERSLETAPLRLDAWLWRLRAAAAARAPKSVASVIERAVEMHEAAVRNRMIPALRGVSSLVALAASLPHSVPSTTLLRSARRLAETVGSALLDHPHLYSDVSALVPGKNGQQTELTLRKLLKLRLGEQVSPSDHRNEL